MGSLLYEDMDELHRVKSDFVAARISPLLAAAQPGCCACYETDGIDEFVCLLFGPLARSVNVTGDNLWGIVVDVAKVLARM